MGIIVRQSLKASLSNYFGIVLGFLGAFFLGPLFYSPDELGGVRLLIELGAVFSGFALIGTNYSINRFFPYFKTSDQKHNGFFFWVFSIPLIGYSIVLFCLVLFKDTLIPFFKSDVALVSKLFPFLIVLILFTLFHTVLDVSNANHGRIAVPNFLREVVLRIGIIISGLVYFLKIVTFNQALWLIVATYGLVVLLSLIYLRSLTKIHIIPDFKFFARNPDVKQDALKYTSWLFLSGITAMIVSKIDFIMISTNKSLSETAVYSIAFYLAILIEIPKRTMLQIATPVISNHMKSQNLPDIEKLYKQLANNQLLLGTILLSLIWVNIDNLFSLIPKGEFYTHGKNVVLIIGMGRLVDMVGSVASPILANSKFYFWGLVNAVVSIFIAILANYLLIPVYGISGAAIATIITFLLSQGVSIFIIYQKLKIHPFGINLLKSFLLLLFLLSFSLLGNWFDNVFIDIILKAIVISALSFSIAYKLRISDEFNTMLEKAINKGRSLFKF